VLRGSAAPDCTGDVLTLGPRDAVLIPAATPRAARNDSNAQVSLLMLPVKVHDHAAGSQGHAGSWT
jgi:hypothetical protein